MTIEEIKAIKRLEFILEDKRQCIGSEQNFKAIETVLKLVDKQQKEIEELNKQIQRIYDTQRMFDISDISKSNINFN